MAKIGLISLGCPKNVVDAEEILGAVKKAGHEIETDPGSAEIVIVNTCGFIQSAKEESIEAILEAVRYKADGSCRSVVVTGCLSKRYGAELAEEIPEADAILGVGAAKDIARVISELEAGNRPESTESQEAWWLESRDRVLSTSPWTAYLRIADGCDNRCSYCAIPDIRGGFRSRAAEDIIGEARGLAEIGVKELNLVAQDVTRYGLDIHGRLSLAGLMRDLVKVDGVEWIRLLYCYPTRITDELIDAIGASDKVCKYIDVPLQHCSNRVLESMGRSGSKEEYLRLVDRIRRTCAEAALRTTFIVGFPGETDVEFEELCEFVQTVQFDRLGVFAYSPEDGTPASTLKKRVSKKIKAERLDRLMKIQQEISLKKNVSLVGKRIRVLVEGREGDLLFGRSYRDAPEIDGCVYVQGAQISEGEFIDVEITEARHYDLYGRCLG